MTVCPECSAEIALDALSCPQCRRLTRAADLEVLTRQAKAAWRVGKFAEERALWRQCLDLLPSGTVQYASIEARVKEIEEQTAIAGEQPGRGWNKATAGVGPTLVLLLTKGKALLLGLTKVGTLVTMAASLSVYWALYGWALAFGLVLSIYIHEMGHVIAIRQYGFRASAPMFVPGGRSSACAGCGFRRSPIPASGWPARFTDWARRSRRWQCITPRRRKSGA